MLCVATSLLFSVIVFFGCNFQGNFWVFASVYYLTSMVGITLAYAVAALVPTMDAANAALPVAVTMWLYFGTFFITTSEMPDYAAWFSWTSFLRYAWGALLNNQFRDTASGEAPIFFGNENRSSPSQADGMLAYGGGAWLGRGAGRLRAAAAARGQRPRVLLHIRPRHGLGRRLHRPARAAAPHLQHVRLVRRAVRAPRHALSGVPCS